MLAFNEVVSDFSSVQLCNKTCNVFCNVLQPPTCTEQVLHCGLALAAGETTLSVLHSERAQN